MSEFLTINFKKSEFACSKSCGCSHNFNMDLHFVMLLQELRTRCGFPLVINSGYRCPEWNEKVGGVVDSWHTKGLAVDIHCVDSIRRLAIVKHAMALGFSDIGVAKTFIHLDNRPNIKQRIRVY
jgi:zinc D-Ala-D-Ala carboxypeptidase